MQFRVAPGRVRDRSRVPRALRPLPAWAERAGRAYREGDREPDRSWTISIGGAFKTTWLLNGRTYNPARSDAYPELGTTETWELFNRTGVAHVMHMHHTDWYLLARDGRRPPPFEDCLKETFFVHPGERILVAGRFADHPGRFPIHCHMLDHEDHGLMSQFEVVRRGDPRADRGA
jgi:FtsP/CotA-like multicopper oxidase with cupredoxin domain